MMTWSDVPIDSTGAPGGPKPSPAPEPKPEPKADKPKPEPGPQEGDIVHTEPLPIPEKWHAKHISMVLSYHRAADLMKRPCYQLQEISETNLYTPGSWFTHSTMHQINLNPQWSTRTVNFDYLQALSSLLGITTGIGIHVGVP